MVGEVQGTALIGMRLGVIGAQRDGLAVAGNRFHPLPPALPSVAEIVVGFGIGGVTGDRLPQGSSRRIHVTALKENNAKTVGIGRLGRIGGDRRTDQRLGTGGVPR
ncbi:hypothetical protein HQ394_09980 [Defluviicoccus vanus]|uniref:Uncharacterized protein n=1 Tax=Defluviicoccus vanus TaxID=111831 RepID=A0A7H1N1K9_9PROT|nr:hypothetical protein HQ394_09980 [Defluviicoccus vanus]